MQAEDQEQIAADYTKDDLKQIAEAVFPDADIDSSMTKAEIVEGMSQTRLGAELGALSGIMAGAALMIFAALAVLAGSKTTNRGKPVVDPEDLRAILMGLALASPIVTGSSALLGTLTGALSGKIRRDATVRRKVPYDKMVRLRLLN